MPSFTWRAISIPTWRPPDRHLLDSLFSLLRHQAKRARFIYTGGCWLYGATGHQVANESTPFDPLAAFAWMAPNLERILSAREVEGIVIHPAMVFDSNGGCVFRRFAVEARERGSVRVVAHENIRWPLVHCDDLAELYGLALEHAPAGSSYIGAAIPGCPVGRIARSFAERFGNCSAHSQIISDDAIAAELGEWARGYGRDQQLSGAKARRELGWRPKHLDVEDEIAKSATARAG